MQKILKSITTILLSFSMIFGSTAMLLVAPSAAMAAGPAHNKLSIGYYPNWAVYSRDVYPGDLPVEKYSHLIYSFLNVVPNGSNFKCQLGDEWADLGKADPDRPSYGNGVLAQMRYLRDSSGRNNSLKLILSVAGATWSTHMAAAASTSTKRQALASSCISLMRTYNFDGIDLDWEFPANTTEGNNYALLMQEFRAQLNAKESSDFRQYSLSAAVMVDPSSHPQRIPLATVAATLDWVGMMNYDYNGAWGAPWKANHNAPLYRSSEFPNDNFSMKDTMDAYHNGGAGIPYAKLVMGYGFYGRGFAGVASATNGGLFQNGTGPSAAHTFADGASNEAGIADYEYIKSLIGTGDWQYTFDREQKVPYIYSPSTQTFFSYDDASSAKAKIAFMKRYDLAGVMVWDLSNEDNVGGVGHTLSNALDTELNTPYILTSSGSFVESSANTGSVAGSQVVFTLAGDTFRSEVSNGAVFASGTHYTMSNIPTGFTVVLTKTSPTVATLTLTGNATSHANTNDIQNLAIVFLDGAFSVLNAGDIILTTFSNLVVNFNDPPISITYIPSTFIESGTNSGAISTVVAANLSNLGGTYAATLTAGSNVVFSGVPAGLTGSVSRTGNYSANLTLTGSATAHANTDDTNVTVQFTNAAFSTNDASGVTNATKSLVVDFNSSASIAWAGNFTESNNNNGAFTGTRTATLSGAAFNYANANMAVTTDYTVTNLPPGLSSSVAVNSIGTIATITLTGTATSHTVANNVSNLTYAFTNNAFQSGLLAASVGSSSNNTGTVTFVDKQISYSTETFGESSANTGAVANVITATLAGDTYGAALTAGTHVLFTNLPAGLTGAVTRTNSTVASLSLTGSATNHANTNDISNLGVAFQNGAFTGGSAVSVVNASKLNFSVDFDDVASIAWVGNFAEAVANNGSVTGTRTATLTNDTFAGPAVGSNFTSGTHFTAVNVPTGLTAVLTKTSSSLATLTMTGNATAHGSAQNASNVTVTFQNGAFTDNTTATTVTGYTNTAGVVTFVDSGALAYSLTTFTENAGNTGAISHSITATLTGDTFAGTLTSGGNVTFTNFPTGLTAVIIRDTATQASISVSGTATSHANTNDISNASVVFGNAAFVSNNAASVQQATRALAFDFTDGATVTWSGDFTESVANSGIMTGARTATLTGDTYHSSIGSNFVSGTHFTISNIPAGLTAVLTKTNSTVATLTFSGASGAAQHTTAQNISNLAVTFLNSAFTNTTIAANATGYSNGAGSITFMDVGIVWAGSFAESATNDGSVTGTRTATLTGDTYSASVANGGTFTQGANYNASNIPAGLTTTLTKTSATVATLTLTGNATSSTTANNVSNLTVTFLNSAFTNTTFATNVSGYINPSGVIVFSDIATNGILLWLRADKQAFSDSGTTAVLDGQTVTQWNDISHVGIAASQATAGRRALYSANALNGNPVLSFDNDSAGNEDFYSIPTTFLPLGGSARSYFFVAKPLDNDPGSLDTSFFTHGLEESNPGGKMASFSLYTNNTAVGVGGHKYGVSSGQSSTGIYRWQLSASAQSTNFTAAINGGSLAISTLNGSARTIDTQATEAFLGRNPSAASLQSFDGDIAEVLITDSNLSTTEARKIDSYLAIKYGITLDQTTATTDSGVGDYTNTTGATTWDAHNGTIQNPYRFDISGIGRDDSRQLTQTQSRSSNPTAILRIADATSLDNNDYAVAGHDNGALTWTSTGAPAEYRILSRNWEVRNTGSVGTLDLEFDTANASADVPALLSGTSYYVIVDTNDNGSLSDETPIPMKDDGTIGDDVSGNNKWTKQMTLTNADSTTLFTVATEFSAAGITYANGIFTETGSNTGVVSGAMTATLANETYISAVANGSAFTGATHYTATNIPPGLTAVLTKTSSTIATLILSGSATSHVNSDDVASLTLVFNDSAFTGGSASSVTGSTKNNIIVDFTDTASVVWSGSFSESVANDGSITSGNTRTATLSGDTYTPSVSNGAVFTQGTHYTVSNVPSGLTAMLTKTNSTIATLTLTGNATTHASASSVANLAVNLQNAAFTTALATAVPGSSDGVGVVTFIDTKAIVWSGNFTETALNTGAVAGVRTATLLGDVYTNSVSIGSTFTSGTHYTTANVPGGLTAVIIKTSSTVATITLAGASTSHAMVNSSSNITVTFQDGTFQNTANASLVGGRTNSQGVITFFDSKLISWSGNFTESTSNNGTVTAGNTRRATLLGASFISSIPKGGQFVPTVQYTVANLPTGLTANLVKLSATRASLQLSGAANPHTVAQNISNLTISLLDAAFADATAVSVAGSTDTAGVVTFINAPSIIWGGGFTESSMNDGSVTGVRTATLTGDTYRATITDGNAFPTTLYTVTNVPRGMSALLTKTSSTVATLTLNGNALSHAAANSITNLTVALRNRSFTNTVQASNIINYFDTTGAVVFGDPMQLAYSGVGFNETSLNNGAVSGVITVTQMGDTFTSSVAVGSDLTAGTHYTSSNVPTGLTMQVKKTSTTQLEISLLGNAASHVNASDVSNIGITFLNSAFTGGNANIVVNANKTNILVDFNDPASIVWSGSFVEAVANNGTVTGSRTASISGDTFNSSIADGAVFTVNTHFATTNVPTGLTAVITKTSSTIATLTLTGAAISNASSNNISNLTITFGAPAFTNSLNTTISGYTNSTGTISFDDNGIPGFTIVQSGGTTAVSEPTTTDTITVVLAVQPATDVVISAVSSNTAQATASPATLTFTDSNWNTPQTITITAVDDSVVDGIQNLGLTLSIVDASSDDAYDPVSDQNILVTVADNDAPANNSISWSGGFTESSLNNGSLAVGNIRRATLIGDTFTSAVSKGSAFTLGTHYTVANVPTGMTPVLTRMGPSLAAFSLVGSATAHQASDSISNLTVVFMDGMFTLNALASSVAGSSNALGVVTFTDPASITWAGDFAEAVANDGAITPGSARTATLSGDNYTGSVAVGNVFTPNTHYMSANIPAGLTMVLTKTSNAVATATLTGASTVHTTAQNVSNLTITFMGRAFTANVLGTTVTGYTDTSGGIIYTN